ncbi:hypothetical protein KI387_041519, partial [Taxus chinensis]
SVTQIYATKIKLIEEQVSAKVFLFFVVMDKSLYRPNPVKGGFRRFTAMLSQNDITDDDIYSIDDDYPYSVSSTQMSNEEVIIPTYVPSTEKIIDEVNIPTNGIHLEHINDSPLHHEKMSTKEPHSQGNQPSVPPAQKGRARWSITETVVLIEAKRIERDTQLNDGTMKRTITENEKWRIVEDYCCTHGLLRTASQCRDRWEHVLPDYKRVRDYEAHIPSGHDSYWSMTRRERVEKKLPANFAMELFDAMDISFGNDRAINPGKISIDTSDTQYAFTEGGSSPIENEPLKECEIPTMTGESLLNTGKEKEKLSTGKKWKTSNKTTSIKDNIVESNKLVISAFQMAEEGRMKRHEIDREREDKNEERLFKIEEQKINVQMNMVSAMNAIGQAMLKMTESFASDK